MNKIDYEFDEVVAKAVKAMKQGNTIHQKWTCGACGLRITMDKPNAFFTQGVHEDCPVNPEHVTDIQKQGCNFLALRGIGGEIH